MLTRAQINKAINDRVKAEFVGIPIQSSDVQEGFERPSFYVSLETRGTETFQFNRRREFTCRIKYFPKDRYVYKEEAYDAQDRLEVMFGLNFPINDRVITIDGAETDLIDKVLHYDFDFVITELIKPDDPGQPMEELVVDGGL
ncbi:phage tail terminator family protein [Cohnella abietis]|uniref:Phage protein n=1 Tax=Cohnella abietis TaxID=2507935 RepID=A0A3T1D322_9BACL|nr:hypothetical protein KCTCHS21_18830 [Cohnella abietis]